MTTSGTTAYKRCKCDICGDQVLTQVARLDEDEFALEVPPDWRLIWNGKQIRFRCPECWSFYAATLEPAD
jgi:hypothetical protein